uniref:Transmembrane p24 trafficking protein 1 n=1 Tax=Ovis aries TaxID=9940 RepID=A0AC11B336_SHEEP
MMAAGAALGLALWLLLPPVGVGGAGPPPIQDGEFTFLLPAGRKQCFYQSAPANASLETEYQVIGGAGLDVDFSLESPQGVLLVSESRKADGVHTVEPTEAGDYKLCFDNSFSTISEKLVFFELIFDSLQDEEEVEGWAEAVEPEEILDVKMEDIKESIETMRTRLERSIQVLTLLRAFEEGAWPLGPAGSGLGVRSGYRTRGAESARPPGPPALRAGAPDGAKGWPSSSLHRSLLE